HYIATMQQNDHRPFLPAPRAAVEPAINDVILVEAARSRRGKLEVSSRLVEIEFHPRRLTFGGNEVRPLQELERFLQPQSSSINGRHPHAGFLNEQPIDKCSQRRDHVFIHSFMSYQRRLSQHRADRLKRISL